MVDDTEDNRRLSAEEKLEELTGPGVTPPEQDVEAAIPEQAATKEGGIDWDTDPQNPLNWPAKKKFLLITMLSSAAILA